MDIAKKPRVPPSLAATPEDVRHAYRLLLGREPDSDGLRFFTELARERQLTSAALGDLFTGSEEYHSKKAAEGVLEEISIQGFRLFPRISDQLIGGAMRKEGHYEPWVTNHFLLDVRPGFRVLDVGANIGFFSMLSSRAVGPTGNVVAVEPLERNLRSLYAAVVANECANVQVLAIAASDANSILRINCESDSSNGVLVENANTGEPVQAGALDDWLAGETRLDLVKIDVEGHEPKALAGMRGLLEKFKPILYAEFGPHGVKKHSSVEPIDFANWFFDYGSVEVLQRNGERKRCRSSIELLDVWARANARASMNGLLHLDIRVESKG